MRLIFGILYTFLFFSYVATGLFIVFHLLRYSLNRKGAIFGALFFAAVLGILLFSNAVIFFSLPFDRVLPLSSSFSRL